LVLPTIAETLGMKESGAQPLARSLADYLRDKELLLLLDNFEHLPEAGTDVAELLGEAPKLHLLVTSRAPLRVLAEHEYLVQPLVSRVGVLAGGFTLAAAEAICDPESELGIELLDGLSSLVEKSLLRQAEGPDGHPRFSLLETVREYALEELGGRTEADELRERHARFFSALARRGGQELMGPGESRWLERLRADHDNL